MSTKSNPDFINQLVEIKIKLIKFLYSLFIILGVIAFFFLSVNLILDIDSSEKSYIYITLPTAIVMTLGFVVIRMRVNFKNYKSALVILMFFFIFISIQSAIVTGTYSTFHYPFIIAAVLALTVVFNVRTSFIFITSLYLLFMAISYLHNNNIIKYLPEESSSNIQNVTFTFIIIFAILNIAKIAYEQIEQSYMKALEYSKELENLNKTLDKRIKNRTQLLQKNFQEQVDSMYTAAIVGNITRSLLHDIATPLSALTGVIDLINTKKELDDELTGLAKESTQQITDIILETRELMSGREIESVFDVSKHIDKVLKILQTEFYKNEVKFKFTKNEGFFIKGLVGLFERIIINLLANANEELKNKATDRQITINLKAVEPKKVAIEIEDNGRGIDEKFQEQIFEEDFSMKHNSHNLGLGLPFVKRTMETKFKGKVKIESIKDKYTKFILTFDLDETNTYKAS